MFQFKSGFLFHWLLKTRQEEGNQTAEQTSLASTYVKAATQDRCSKNQCGLCFSFITGVKGRNNESLWGFVPQKKSTGEFSTRLFLSRGAKAKNEEFVLVGVGDGFRPLLCHRLTVLALVSSHRVRSRQHHLPVDV